MKIKPGMRVRWHTSQTWQDNRSWAGGILTGVVAYTSELNGGMELGPNTVIVSLYGGGSAMIREDLMDIEILNDRCSICKSTELVATAENVAAQADPRWAWTLTCGNGHVQTPVSGDIRRSG